MWMAVFADMGASLLVVANGLRLLRTRQPRQPREAEATASRPAPMPDSPVTSR
jgi:Cd2+/Zn2+-exporting ATPase